MQLCPVPQRLSAAELLEEMRRHLLRCQGAIGGLLDQASAPFFGDRMDL